MESKRFILRLFGIIFLAQIVACGGDGSTVTTAQLPNIDPVADAGDDQTVTEFETVTLSGSGSDSDGNIASYHWVQTSGITVAITNANSSNSSFEAPEVVTHETLIFELIVTDNVGAIDRDSVTIDVNNKTEFLWSDKNAWGGSFPNEGDRVTIPAGITILLDINTPSLSGLIIDGTLKFDRQSLELTSDWILVNGNLQIGTESEPFINKATITLTGDPSQNIMEAGSRGIMVMNGSLELFGKAPQRTWSQISQHVEAGATEIQVLETDDWKQGDQIILAPTDFFEVGESQLLSITTVNDNLINVSEPVQKFRWGKLQHLSASGMSINDGGSSIPQDSYNSVLTPQVLDERAEVGNLTRNIVIQGADDVLWQDSGFGSHVMIMGLDSTVHVDGVEFRRSGQAGRLGRYPFHWHKLSYADDGTELGDALDHYLRNSTIHNSANRCVTIHATNGIQFQNNICYDVLGHGIFFEDAVERRNVIENNLILGVRFPTEENALMLHEITQVGVSSGSSGGWITNPDNIVRNNVFADSEGFGLWMAFPENPQGVSSNVSIQPNQLTFGNFDNNIVHSNRLQGVMFDNPPIDNDGRVFPLQYSSSSEQLDTSCPDDNFQRFTISGWQLWKNGGNFWNRATCANYVEFVSADSIGKYFSGAGSDGIITRSLLVGNSLNNLSVKPQSWKGPATGMATYHSAFDITQNVIVNFPLVEGKTSGAFATDDYYFRPVEKGQIRNKDNLLINSHGGHRSNAQINEQIDGNFAQGFSHLVFAGALWDPNGIWGDSMNWSVYDRPFFTHNATCNSVPESLDISSCDGTYFGVSSFILEKANEPWFPLMALDVNRLGENFAIIDNWHIDAGEQNFLLPNMRHFAVSQNGIYQLNFPDLVTPPSDVAFDLSNMHEANDSFILAVSFNGTSGAKVYATTFAYPHYLENDFANSAESTIKRDYTELLSLQEVIDSNGETYWQDQENDFVWIKVSLADLQQNSLEPPKLFSDRALYNNFHLRIW